MEKMTHRLTTELKRVAFENHDFCVSCKYQFFGGDTSHLGYGQHGEPLYVCDNCSYLLKETAVRYHFAPRPYKVPEPHSKLWRYIDFTKYVSLLSSKGLYFSSADCFDDAFEGAKGLRNRKEKWDEHYLRQFRGAIKNPPEGHVCELSEDEIEQEARRLLSELEVGGEDIRKRTFISCWHESEYESEAMWKLYSTYLQNAVAVRTSFQNLYKALGSDPSINIGRVQYIDMNKKYANPNSAFWRKRKSFEHEKEVRAVYYDFEFKGPGKLMACDLTILIEEVYVSPQAPSWFVHLVNNVNDKFGVNVKVSSELLTLAKFKRSLCSLKYQFQLCPGV